jgi:hypothetical protein
MRPWKSIVSIHFLSNNCDKYSKIRLTESYGNVISLAKELAINGVKELAINGVKELAIGVVKELAIGLVKELAIDDIIQDIEFVKDYLRWVSLQTDN